MRAGHIVVVSMAVVAFAFTGTAAGHSKPRDEVDGGKPAKRVKVRAHKTTAKRGYRADTRSRPILFVHGLDAIGDAGADCAGTWNRMRDQLRAWGHTGAHQTIKYYWADSGCTATLDNSGSHSVHYPRTDAHQNGSHDMDGDIRHLGYHLAWYIYNTYSRHGTVVDLVGHSMGGLISRYAVWGAGRHADFPPYVYVEDAVTLGTPHAGSGFASWCPWAYQCNQMQNGSSFINWLASNAPNPQASGGTDWTTVGSYDDGVVSEGSATSMSASHKVRYFNMGIGHSDYQHDVSDARDADTEYNDYGGPWYAWYNAPHAVRWSDYALTYGSW